MKPVPIDVEKVMHDNVQAQRADYQAVFEGGREHTLDRMGLVGQARNVLLRQDALAASGISAYEVLRGLSKSGKVDVVGRLCANLNRQRLFPKGTKVPLDLLERFCIEAMNAPLTAACQCVKDPMKQNLIEGMALANLKGQFADIPGGVWEMMPQGKGALVLSKDCVVVARDNKKHRGQGKAVDYRFTLRLVDGTSALHYVNQKLGNGTGGAQANSETELYTYIDRANHCRASDLSGLLSFSACVEGNYYDDEAVANLQGKTGPGVFAGFSHTLGAQLAAWFLTEYAGRLCPADAVALQAIVAEAAQP